MIRAPRFFVVSVLVLVMACQPPKKPVRMANLSTPWSLDSLMRTNHTPTYEDAVAISRFLAEADERFTLHEIGVGDVGRPIYALAMTGAKATPKASIQDRVEKDGHGLVTVLVNNAIHPGEPCGVNASLALAWQWMEMEDGPNHPLRKANWVIVPQYNVGGAGRRNCCTRANQNGPEWYGFRGNARNLDLNRDFVKMDSRNADAFVSLYHSIDPDVFIDTHTSNGADYPYTMTLISTQPDKAGPEVGGFLRNVMEPAIYAQMEKEGWPMVPYVYSMGETPEDGIMAFLETPRYSTGFTTLFGTLGFTTEAHMLKPFQDRVAATHAFLQVMSTWLQEHAKEVMEVRERERLRIAQSTHLPVRWTLGEERDQLLFEGYDSRREWSQVTGGVRLRYDRTSSWTRAIPYANQYVATDSIAIPDAWIVPQAWRHVVERLQKNGVQMDPLPQDTVMLLKVTFVEEFESTNRPYEGHHPLSIDSIRQERRPIQLHRGDWVISSNQPAKRYLAEVLAPKGMDSFLTWNFFDAALQRKEYYSGYVFEETALELLSVDEALKAQFEFAQEQHPEWEENPSLALRWLYEHSPHDEGTANMYPVYGWTHEPR